MRTIAEVEEAIKNNDIAEIKSILKCKNIYLQSNHSSVLRFAYSKKRIAIVKLLLKDGRANPNELNNELIGNVASDGNLVLFKMLLKDPRVDPSDFMNRAFIASIKNNHLAIVKLLLEDDRIDPFNTHTDAIYYSFKNNRTKMRDLIWNSEKYQKSNKNDDINTIAQYGTLDMLKQVMSEDNIQERIYSFVLFFAYTEKNTANVEYLWSIKKVRDGLEKNKKEIFDKLNLKFIKSKISDF